MSAPGARPEPDASTTAPAPPREGTPGVQPVPVLRGRTVLVVDDVAQVARSTGRLLELFGARPSLAQSGAEALRLIEGEDFDLLIVDLGLPDLDGAELLRRVRARRPRQRALFVSGLPPGEALPAGAALVSKPFSVADLLAAVEHVLSS